MLRLRDIDHVVLRVRDMDAMVRFYCDVIGCIDAGRRADGKLVHLRAGTSVIDLIIDEAQAAAPRHASAHNMDHFCLNVENFEPEAVAKHLETHGVKAGKLTARGSFFIDDPEGNCVELKGCG